MRASRPTMYSVLIVILGMLVSMTVAIGISVQASNKAIRKAQEAENRNRALQAQLDVENRAASCAFIRTIRDAYLKDPPDPPSDTYKTVTKAWVDLAKRCE